MHLSLWSLLSCVLSSLHLKHRSIHLQVVGITPARLTVLNKAAKLPTSMSAPLKSSEEGGNTLEDIVEVRHLRPGCMILC
jgi:hypothetical protein